MKVGSLICGLLGGLTGLLAGYFCSASLTSLAGSLGWARGGFYQAIAIAIALPLAAAVGGRLALSNRILAGVLMIISAAGTAIVYGVDSLTLIPVALSSIGAVLAFFSRTSDTA